MKKIYFQNKSKKYENNVKKILLRVQNDYFSKSLTIANEEITGKTSMAQKCNSFFVITG